MKYVKVFNQSYVRDADELLIHTAILTSTGMHPVSHALERISSCLKKKTPLYEVFCDGFSEEEDRFGAPMIKLRLVPIRTISNEEASKAFLKKQHPFVARC